MSTHQKIRVRFAPSPTGPLHPGGLRTVLYNDLLAKQKGGTLILRIEDTDQERLVPGSQAYIEEVLAWVGIIPDEGPKQGGPHAPYIQSERRHIYAGYIEQLLQKGAAYYAFDTPEELEAMRQRQAAIGVQAPKYNALTRLSMRNSLSLPAAEVSKRLANQEPYVVRLLVDYKKNIKFKDVVRGWVQFQGAALDDKVLIKSDGMPTYHFANVVDDHVMEISHVIRGEEWLPSTPIHLLLYEAFGWQPPVFAHLPLILNADGQGKLSKRVAVSAGIPIFPLNWHDEASGTTFQGFREQGYLPEAFINFIALLGWHPPGNEELLSRAALIEKFSLERINKAGARFDIAKAKWFNSQYIKALTDEVLAERYLLPILQKQGIQAEKSYVLAVCRLVKERLVFPQDLFEKNTYFFLDPVIEPTQKEIIQAKWSTPLAEALAGTVQQLAVVKECTPARMKALIQQEGSNHAVPLSDLLGVVRIATTGSTTGPDLMELLALLGKKTVIKRLKQLLASQA